MCLLKVCTFELDSNFVVKNHLVPRTNAIESNEPTTYYYHITRVRD